MAQQLEYRVCTVQQNRITWVNAEWQGKIAPTGASVDVRLALESCPLVWDYLNTAGHEGWELIQVVQGNESIPVQTLYLKHERYL